MTAIQEEVAAAYRAIEEAQAVQLGLHRALIRAVPYLDGEVRLIALAAIAKAEGREEGLVDHHQEPAQHTVCRTSEPR
jgi:hypothetical protein